MKERLHFSLLRSKEKQLGLAALLTLLCVSTYYDFAMLLRYPVAVGLDGYYYVLQIDEFLRHGRFYFPTFAPLILYFLAGITFLTDNTVLAVKVGSMVLHALLCLGIFAIVASTTRSVWLGVLGCALALASQLHLYMVSEFIKNLGAVALLLWCGWCVLRAVQTSRRLWVYLSILCLTAATLSHRSALAVAGVPAASTLLIRWLVLPESHWIYRRIAIVMTIILCSAPAIVVRQAFVKLPTWITDEMLGHPQWPISNIGFIEKTMLLAVCPATLFVILYFRELLTINHEVILLGSVALLSLLITINPFLNYNFGWIGISARLSSLAYIQLAILVPGLIWLVHAIQREITLYAVVLTIPMLATLHGYARLPIGMQPDFLSERVQMIRALSMYRQQVSPDHMVIAPHGDQFVVTSALGVPSQQRWPQSSQEQTIYWLLRHIEHQALSSSMIILLKGSNGLHTVLIRDDDLRQTLEAMTGVERLRLFVTNPHLGKKYGVDVGNDSSSIKRVVLRAPNKTRISG